jgi:hypothetical protein
MKRFIFSIGICCLLFTILLGCTRLALRLSPTLIDNFAASLFEECDVPMAQNAIPANLMLLEGLLKNDPDNKKILTSLAMGFTGYSLLFVEEGDPDRASRLYERAREYGLYALGKQILSQAGSGGPEAVESVSKDMGHDAFEPLFWYTMAWIAWINLNLDKPIALSHLGATQRLTARLIELNGSYMHGLPHVLLGTTLAALPPLLGGKPDQAKKHFEKAMTLSQGRFFLVQYYYARYYAVRVQNRGLFMQLIDEILGGSPKGMKDVCLINAVVQDQAKELEQRVDDLFI